MNTKLLQKVANAILDEPTHFDMSDYLNYCGTTACIGGHAVAISERMPELRNLRNLWMIGESIADRAKSDIEINQHQSNRLFRVSNWPKRFQVIETLPLPEERSEIAFWRIQHFIATEGRE